jgi:hypothetical protein
MFFRRSEELTFGSRLARPAGEVWNVVGTMRGVNAELGPWLRMTVPEGAETMRVEDAPLGKELFASWVLFLGVPIDRHYFKLERVDPGRGFREKSRSWTEARWVHERSVVPAGRDACVLTDRLEMSPRVRAMAPLLVRVVTAVFQHRHRRLRARFGEAPAPPA